MAMFENAVCISVETRRLGVRRKVATGGVSVQEGVDREYLHVSKDILQSKKLEDITRHQGEIRRFLQTRCTPSPLFRGGIYLLANRLISEVDDRLVQAQATLDMLVEAFLAEYDGAVAQAQQQLGSLFDPTEYPNVEKVRGTFGISWCYLTVDTPSSLQAIRADLFKREQEKAAAQWQDAMSAAEALLHQAFSDLVTHMIDRLTPGDDGKPKTFRNSLVENFREYLTTFDARNIGNSEALAAEVGRARDLLGGLDCDALRHSDSLKASIAAGLATIKAQLDTMVVDRGRSYGPEE